MPRLKQNKPLKAKTPLRAKTPLKANKKPNKQAKPTVAKLKKKADALHSRAIRLRWADKVGGDWYAKCITCGATKNIKELQCGHFMSRSHNATRYDDENTAPQCYGCNVKHQGKQYQFGLELDFLYGVGTADKLHQLSKQPHQFTVAELEEIIHDRTEEIKFYEKEN